MECVTSKKMNQMHGLGRSAAGFTLIELMIAIVLGLLLVAAATQLFTGGLITTRLQQANAEIQDSGIFGLEYIARDLRLINYGNVSNPELNDQTAWGGIVFSANNTLNLTENASATEPASLPNNVNFISNAGTAAGYLSAGLLSHSVGASETVSTTTNEWKGLSNVSGQNSDQLTIQFIAPSAMTNCEGAAVQANDLVVQRYFMRPDPSNSTTSTNYALACDANTPTAVGTAPQPKPMLVTGLGGAGEIIMPRVDHFHVLLGVRNAAGNFAYYTINQYKTAATTARTALTKAPRIISVKLAVLVRSTDNTNSPAINAAQSFVMFDQAVVPTDTTTRYNRQVYSTNIALRNGLGDIQ